MQPNPAPHTPPAPRRLTLAKETLRRLTPADLRLAAGGAGRSSNDPLACRAAVNNPSKNPTAC